VANSRPEFPGGVLSAKTLSAMTGCEVNSTAILLSTAMSYPVAAVVWFAVPARVLEMVVPFEQSAAAETGVQAAQSVAAEPEVPGGQPVAAEPEVQAAQSVAAEPAVPGGQPVAAEPAVQAAQSVVTAEALSLLSVVRQPCFRHGPELTDLPIAE
jgi:hypothetical protein